MLRKLLRRRREGQSLVEFALVLPALILMIVVVTAIGLAFYSYLVIINAARDGGRLGALGCERTALRYGADPATITETECAQFIAEDTRRSTEPLSLDANNSAIIVTWVKTTSSGGSSSFEAGYPLSVKHAGLSQTLLDSHFSGGGSMALLAMLDDASLDGSLLNGSNDFVIVEIYYEHPVLFLSQPVPMYTYTMMRMSSF